MDPVGAAVKRLVVTLRTAHTYSANEAKMAVMDQHKMDDEKYDDGNGFRECLSQETPFL